MLVLLILINPVFSSETQTGPVTDFPLPRFVSMKASKANVRRGPSLKHKIDWVYKHQNIPLEIIAEHSHWRKVRDRDGQGGWMHYSLLTGIRTVIVIKNLLQLNIRPDKSSPVIAALEDGAVTRLKKCIKDWCQVRINGYQGWVPKDGIWGVNSDEIYK
ncbi:MAG: SH3 domain-containing protein [Aestuariivita sp.]|nr:SH3 domain-containing protein [Aestuariivita sp.]